jgi:acyl-CoA synthetase (AMP-forming)/AMP-acid ligase II
MLNDRWRQIAADNRNELALVDLASERRWTFGQLLAATDSESCGVGAVSYPQGLSAEFVLTVLRAWRSEKVVCPLETGQSAPSFAKLPVGSVHLKLTSATTGAPRVIAFTAEQLVADVANIVVTMGLRRDWTNVGIISLAHSYGFSNLVLPLLLHGIPLILLSSPLPEAVRRAAREAANITLPAVPALWSAWQESDAIPPNVGLAISAGAPLPLPLEQAVFEKAGIKLHNFYGASECGGIAYDTTLVPRSDAACIGAPMRNVQLSVNEEGCLEVRSRAVGETYWPERNENLVNRCYRTRDLAELKNGLVFLRGRASDLINVAGRKVSPESVERVLLTHPDVRDCLVFGAPSERDERGETIVAVVAGRRAVTSDELKQFLIKQLAAWQVPREWLLVDSLEVNQRGKLSRADWRRRFSERPR